MATVENLSSEMSAPETVGVACIQAGSYALELSLDWIVLRASENIHQLLGVSHVTLIDEPLGKFVHSQALHDLRNLFSKLSGTTGIGRAYGVRLTDDPDLVDIAFQLADGCVLLEAAPSEGCFGECFGSVGGLIAGLSTSHGQALLDGGARRMRALTGYDRVTLVCGENRAESSRGPFARGSDASDLPTIVSDAGAEEVALFPRAGGTAVEAALFRAPGEPQRRKLQSQGIKAVLRVPFSADGVDCEFCCENRAVKSPSLELHAAAELFAQMFAMRLAIDKTA